MLMVSSYAHPAEEKDCSTQHASALLGMKGGECMFAFTYQRHNIDNVIDEVQTQTH